MQLLERDGECARRVQLVERDGEGARRAQGFTLIEIAIAMLVVTVLLALTVPSFTRWSENRRLSDSVREIDSAVSFARSEAIRTGNVHLLFFQTDASGNDLVDGTGAQVQILVTDDGRLGSANQNCAIDSDEISHASSLRSGVSWGIARADGPVATDPGNGTITDGTTFDDAGGNPARWILFRPEGPPLAFSSDCSMGLVGTGGGGIYLTNGHRDKAVVVTPLGTTRVHSWIDGGDAWSS